MQPPSPTPPPWVAKHLERLAPATVLNTQVLGWRKVLCNTDRGAMLVTRNLFTGPRHVLLELPGLAPAPAPADLDAAHDERPHCQALRGDGTPCSKLARAGAKYCASHKGHHPSRSPPADVSLPTQASEDDGILQVSLDDAIGWPAAQEYQAPSPPRVRPGKHKAAKPARKARTSKPKPKRARKR